MRSSLVYGLAALLTVSLAAQDAGDAAVVAKIRSEAYDRGKVLDTFDQLANVIGPRLTNSPAHKRSIAWTQETLKSWGLSNVHAEPWEFGRGWTLKRFSVEMLEPRYMPLSGYPRAWSPSTNGVVTATPVWLPNPSTTAMQEKSGKLHDAIVMTSPVQEYFIRADRPPASGDLVTGRPPAKPAMPAADLAAALKKEGVGVTLEANVGEHGTVFVTGRDAGANSVPAIVLVSEHYNLIARLLQRGIPVKLAVNVQAEFDESDRMTNNVIAEIPGTDPAVGSEVVMAGAHLDSWHSATGATDNADGVATVMEAVRILKTLGVKPRRTIRIALWAGEEQGLLGSKAYVQQHLTGDSPEASAGRERMYAYFNFDNGFPPITGFYLEGNQAAKPIVDAWLKPLADLGVTATTLKGIGATDHLSFKAVGIPGFQAVQSYANYDVRTHHTNADFVERIEPDALKQGAVVIATVLYDAAMRDGKFPR